MIDQKLQKERLGNLTTYKQKLSKVKKKKKKNRASAGCGTTPRSDVRVIGMLEGKWGLEKYLKK